MRVFVVGSLLFLLGASFCDCTKVNVRTGDWVWHDFYVDDSTTVLELKELIYKQTGQQIEDQRMIIQQFGEVDLLDNDKTIGSLKPVGGGEVKLWLKDNLINPAGNLIWIQVPGIPSSFCFRAQADNWFIERMASKHFRRNQEGCRF